MIIVLAQATSTRFVSVLLMRFSGHQLLQDWSHRELPQSMSLREVVCHLTDIVTVIWQTH